MSTVEQSTTGLEILVKADAVIRALQRDGELSAAEIAGEVGEPVSSTYRLLTNLSAIGWVEQGPRRGRFRLGVYFMRVGGRLEDRISVREAATPELRNLLARTGATSFLCLRRGTRAVCVERFEGRNVRSLALALGELLPLYLGAAPVALFASLPPSERDAVIDSFDQARGQEPSIPSRPTLLRIAAEAHDRGYAVSDGDVTPGIASIGAPIFNHRGEVEAAISISGLRSQALETTPSAVDLVLTAAMNASRRLGYVGSAR